MTQRRDIELIGETAAYSVAGTALGEAATIRGPRPRPAPARAPPRRKGAAPSGWRARPRDRRGRAAAAERPRSGCRGDPREGEVGRHGRGEARPRPIAAGPA